jgi:plasmid stability protein
MRTLYVRHVPEETYQALRRGAAERKTSIAAEAVRLLRRGLRTDRAAIRDILKGIETHRVTVRRGAPPAAVLIRQDRDAR